MKIGRKVPPAAAPIAWKDLWHGVIGLLCPERSLRLFEEEIRAHFGVSHVFLVSSGTAALTLTLMGLRSSSRRTDVVIPAYTCPSVPAAVLKAGLRPVLCDINPSTFDFDHAQLERTLNENTLCVVAHHLFGIPSDIDRVRALCRTRGIFVVEDAAQAMGVESNGRRLGTLGDVGIFSLGRGKSITCGSGGIIVTSSAHIADAIGRRCRELSASPLAEALKDFAQIVLMAMFIRPRLYWLPAALPFLRLGQTIFPKDVPLKRALGHEGGSPARVADASERIEPDPIGGHGLFQPAVVDRIDEWSLTPLPAAADSRRDADRKGSNLFALAAAGAGIEHRVSHSGQRDPRNERRLQR